MSVGDILDGVFKLLRANFRALALPLVLAALPFEALVAYATRNSVSLSTMFAQFGNQQNPPPAPSGADLTMELMGVAGLFVIAPLVAGIVSKTVAASYAGEELGGATAARLSARHFLALLVASLLGHLMELGGLCLCLLPFFGVAALLFVAAPAIVLEDLGPIAGMRRSWRLVWHRFWPVLGTLVLGALISQVTVSIIGLLPNLLAQAASPHVRAVIDAIVTTCTQALQWALLSILATLLYFDQRIRQEGLDLEVMAARLR
jgi:hypothetical protein